MLFRSNRATQAAGATREPFVFYVAVGAVYLVFTSLSEAFFAWANRRLSVGVAGGRG